MEEALMISVASNFLYNHQINNFLVLKLDPNNKQI